MLIDLLLTLTISIPIMGLVYTTILPHVRCYVSRRTLLRDGGDELNKYYSQHKRIYRFRSGDRLRADYESHNTRKVCANLFHNPKTIIRGHDVGSIVLFHCEFISPIEIIKYFSEWEAVYHVTPHDQMRENLTLFLLLMPATRLDKDLREFLRWVDSPPIPGSSHFAVHDKLLDVHAYYEHSQFKQLTKALTSN